jgi:hypothetical protein
MGSLARKRIADQSRAFELAFHDPPDGFGGIPDRSTQLRVGRQFRPLAGLAQYCQTSFECMSEIAQCFA